MKEHLFSSKGAIILAMMVMIALPVLQGLNHLQKAYADNLVTVPSGKSGELMAVTPKGKSIGVCPLKHTSVTADIAGACARVNVVQEFTNPSKEKIEAVYTFPLPSEAAVDSLEMKVGNRTIKGDIKKKEEARTIYEEAKAQGHVAALLDQERPNIFTQAVANIMPGEKVTVKISYIDLLDYEDGVYEFVFPMVVGPRYMPGAPTGTSGTGMSVDTTKVPDASKISPQITPPGTRAGHDISVDVNIDAGVPIDEITSTQHEIQTNRTSDTSAEISLKDRATIPNKDFILKYRVGGPKIQSGVVAHTRTDGDGFFALILQPPPKPTASQIIPKEMIFVIDTSGSQQGEPIEKSKETMELCIQQMNPNDTFQLVAFSNDVIKCFDKPQPNTPATQAMALTFLRERLGNGGTEMMKAIDAVLTPSTDPTRMRIVCFMTDGYVGNDMDILDTVKKKVGDTRLFSFGIGSSTNRFLLDGMAKLGHGQVEYVTLGTPGKEVAQKFYDRISNPLLTDISIDWGGLDVKQVYPEQIPDLYSSKPIILKGRYGAGGTGQVTINGKTGGKAWSQSINVTLPKQETDYEVLAPLWARAHIDSLMEQDYSGIQMGKAKPDVEAQITTTALEFSLMSQFTSFVAVEKKVVTEGGKPKTISVPVEMPEGVSYEGVFGAQDKKDSVQVMGSTAWKSIAASAANGQRVMGPAGPAAPMSSGGYGSGSQTPTYSKPSAALSNQSLAGQMLDVDSIKQSGSVLDEQLKKIIETWTKTKKLPAKSTAKVKSGKLEVSILGEVSDENLKKLKDLGCLIESSSKSSQMILAWVPINKLEEISKLEFVHQIQLPEYPKK